MDKVLLYEEDIELRASIEAELTKYEGQFGVVVVSSLQEARQLIQQKTITLCVVGFDMKNEEHVDFVGASSAQYTQVPFILMKAASTGNEPDRADIFNILQVVDKPFELNRIANAIIEGLDAIDEGMMWKRFRSSKRTAD